MTTAKLRFQAAVVRVVRRGLYPGPLTILKEKQPGSTRHCLSAREIAWRKETLLVLGWKRHPRVVEYEAAVKKFNDEFDRGDWKETRLLMNTVRNLKDGLPRYRWMKP
jgi:hypothetical protein